MIFVSFHSAINLDSIHACIIFYFSLKYFYLCVRYAIGTFRHQFYNALLESNILLKLHHFDISCD